MRENLSSGFTILSGSDQPAQLQRLARQLHRLICALVVCKQTNQVFRDDAQVLLDFSSTVKAASLIFIGYFIC